MGLYVLLPYSSKSRQRGLLRRRVDLRDGLCALHPGRGYRGAVPYEAERPEGLSHAARPQALQVPTQETGNRK